MYYILSSKFTFAWLTLLVCQFNINSYFLYDTNKSPINWENSHVQCVLKKKSSLSVSAQLSHQILQMLSFLVIVSVYQPNRPEAHGTCRAWVPNTLRLRHLRPADNPAAPSTFHCHHRIIVTCVADRDLTIDIHETNWLNHKRSLNFIFFSQTCGNKWHLLSNATSPSSSISWLERWLPHLHQLAAPGKVQRWSIAPAVPTGGPLPEQTHKLLRE